MQIHICTQSELLCPSIFCFVCLAVLLYCYTLFFPQEKPYCFLDGTACALFLQISSFVVFYHGPQLSALPRCPLTGAQEPLGHSLSLGSTESIQILPGGLGGLIPSQERPLHLLCYRNKKQVAEKTAGTNTKSLFIFLYSTCCQLRNACQRIHWLARFVRKQILYIYIYKYYWGEKEGPLKREITAYTHLDFQIILPTPISM